MYPVFVYSGASAEPLESGDGATRTQCNILWPSSGALGIDGSQQFALYGFVLGFALPVALMMSFYGMVLRHLRNSHEKVTHASSYHPTSRTTAYSRRRTKLRRVTMMIFVLVLVYVLSWTPYWYKHLPTCNQAKQRKSALQQLLQIITIILIFEMTSKT